MATLSRRGFTRRLHHILNWQTYDTDAEHQAVRDARKLLSATDIEAFVREHRSKGSAISKIAQQVTDVRALLTCAIDQDKPLKGWRHGRL